MSLIDVWKRTVEAEQADESIGASTIGTAAMVATPAGQGIIIGKWIMRAVLALLVIAALWFVIDRLFFAPKRAEQKVAQAVATGAAATGQAETAQQAGGIVERWHEKETIIREKTEASRAKILATEGANDAVNPAVARATFDALCLRDAYRGEPACAQVQPLRP